MAQYRYRAQDAAGNPEEGTIEETSAHRVRLKLQERGYRVVYVDLLEKPPGLLRVSQQLSWEEVRLFTDHLRGIVKHGLPLPAALGAMAEDIRSGRLRPVLLQLRKDLEQGRSLEEAINRQHKAFPRLYAPLIRAGEASGNLPGVLLLISKHAAAQAASRNAFTVSLVYPAIVVAAAIGVVLFIVTKVVPVFASIFEEFGGELPPPTRLWIEISHTVTSLGGGLWVAAGVVALLVLLRLLLPYWDPGRYWVDALRLRAPGLGRVHYLAAISRFCRALGLLLKSRVPVVDALELAAAASGSPQLERAVEEAALGVAGGDRISDSLEATRFFPHNFTWLLATSENRGDMDEALEAYAEMAEREAGFRDRSFMSIFPTAVIVFVGLVVLSLVFALYLPIFTLGDAISGT